MNVLVYSTKACPECIKVKEFLKDNNIAFREMDVGVNQEAVRDLFKKSGALRVPVIDIDGTVIIGYDLKKMKKALKLS